MSPNRKALPAIKSNERWNAYIKGGSYPLGGGETSNHEVLSFLPSKVLPLGWIWGVLPVMREVQGCDQHGQHITRGSGVEEGSGMVKLLLVDMGFVAVQAEPPAEPKEVPMEWAQL
ncbi:MAG: hypothetical protein FRX49_06043 [Trebouxia sp. A1-2]|nr:MAG: hypothetical protein FRX49_06043 [Trebouxia sp. A1-2]